MLTLVRPARVRVPLYPAINRGIMRRVKPRKKVWQPKEEDEVPREKYRKELSEDGIMKKAGLKNFHESNGLLDYMIKLRFFDVAETIAQHRLKALQALTEAIPDDREYQQLLMREQFRYAGVLAERKNLDEALSLYQISAESCVRLHGELHVGSDAARNNMATVLVEMGRHSEAEPLFRNILDHAIGDPRLVFAANLVDLLRETGRLEAAKELVEIEGGGMDRCHDQEVRLRWATSEALLDHALLPSPRARRRVYRLVEQMNDELGVLNPVARKYTNIFENLPEDPELEGGEEYTPRYKIEL